MTMQQKQQVQNLRHLGVGYKKIAGTLGISVNTVKSYCQRNNLNAESISAINSKRNLGEGQDLCKQCDKLIIQKSKKKPKTFCSDKCRYAWWNDYRCNLKRKVRRDQRTV